MTDFTTTRTAVGSYFARRKTREVVVQHQTAVSVQHWSIQQLLIHFTTQSNCSQRLSFSASKHSRTVCSRQIIYFSVDRTNLGCRTTVQTTTTVQDHFTHLVVFRFVEIFLGQTNHARFLLMSFELFAIFRNDSLKRSCTLVFGCTAFSYFANVGRGFSDYALAQFSIIVFVVVFTNGFATTHFSQQFHLGSTLQFHSFMTKFQGFQELFFRQFFQFTLNHVQVVGCTTNQHVDIRQCQFFSSRVHDELAIDSTYANFRDRSQERNICQHQRS